LKILAIDTSSLSSSVALYKNEKIVGEIFINNPKTHSQKILTMVDNILVLNNLLIDEIDIIVVSNGPGSFTGLRIGLSTAKGLAHPHNIKVVEVSSLKSMAYNFVENTENLICPIIDARRNQVYASILKFDNEGVNVILEDECLLISDLIEKIDKDEKIIFLGDGVVNHKEYLKQNFKNAKFANENNMYTRASSLILSYLYGNFEEKKYDNVKAIYLRKTEAERNYENAIRG